ncbi:Dtx3l [Symbiodinium necroappetens]|uniref:RING-type E3 ubiquitin transferase n=1 Tax=Symbiodinium necroappetens TaxID=1628268 RepID=A0A812SBT1_9DINO|nr:Dtx3l [Symbiodinium necroappetens]
MMLGPGLGDAKQEATEAKDLGKTFGFVVHDSFKVVCESREARRGEASSILAPLPPWVQDFNFAIRTMGCHLDHMHAAGTLTFRRSALYKRSHSHPPELQLPEGHIHLRAAMGTVLTLALPEEPQLVLCLKWDEGNVPRDSTEQKNLRSRDFGLKVSSSCPEEEICCICLEGHSTVQLPCGHRYHAECLDQWLQRRPTCPTCGQSYGDRTGSMPDGNMRWGWLNRSLSGYRCRTILLHFYFPTGSLHGRIYDGRSLHAFLPDDEQGRHLLALFQLAFRRRLMFSLSQSNTTGRLRPTFAMHLKTAMTGGPTRHGYPDPGYYASAVEELRGVGVHLDEAMPIAVQLESSMVKRKRFTALLEDVVQCSCRFAIVCTPQGFNGLVSFLALVYILVIPPRVSCLHFLNLFCILAFGMFCLYMDDNVGTAINVAGVAYSVLRGFAKGHLSDVCEEISTFARRSVNQHSEAMTICLLLRSSCGMAPFIPHSWLMVTLLWLLKLYLTGHNKRGNSHNGIQQPLLHTVDIEGNIEGAPRRAAPRPPVEAVSPIQEHDWPLYSSCPSLEDRADAVDLFRHLLKPLRPVMRDTVGKIIHELLRNELRYKEDYVVFYHSYSSSCLLYEVQTALAACILDYPIDGPPIPRLRRQPYQNVKCLQHLLQIWESTMHDQTAEFQAVAISAFCSCLASGGQPQNMLQAWLIRGFPSSISAGAMRRMLKDLLLAAGVCSGRAQALDPLVTSILAMGRKYGLRVPSWRLCQQPENPGHLLQIFVHQSVVDAISYGSKARGQLDSGGIPLSRWLLQRSPIDGHSRLLTHPDLFLDLDRGLVHSFAFSAGPYGRERVAMLRELRDLLKPQIQDLRASRMSLGFERPQAETERDLESAGTIYSI